MNITEYARLRRDEDEIIRKLGAYTSPTEVDISKMPGLYERSCAFFGEEKLSAPNRDAYIVAMVCLYAPLTLLEGKKTPNGVAEGIGNALGCCRALASRWIRISSDRYRIFQPDRIRADLLIRHLAQED